MPGQTTDPIPLLTLDNVRKPIAEASGLPNVVYSDPGLFDYERANIFAPTWTALAFVDELPAQGHVKPVDFMGLALVIMHSPGGPVRVFHNVCSHRGMPLIRQAGKVEGSVRCPYHSWTYDLDGNLKGTPHIGGVGVHSVSGFSCASHGLKEVRSHRWLGMLFINLSGEAEAFETHVGELEARWAQFTGEVTPGDIHPAATGSSMQLEIRANWKLAVENYC